MKNSLKESNWQKQYDRLLCSDCKEYISEEEYESFWEDEFGELNLRIIQLPKEDSIQYESEKEIESLGKTYKNVAFIQPKYILDDDSEYTPENDLFKTLYFVEDTDGSWRFLWWEK